MATRTWIGTATAVAQVSDTEITAYDAASVYGIVIGGDEVSVAADTDANTTAGNLVTALEASTNPYFSGITWSNPTGAEIVGTSQSAGLPFTFTTNVTGGTGTFAAVTDTTANKSPYDWADADNWAEGSVPVNGDDVVIASTDKSILYNIDQNAVTLDSLEIRRNFTGLIGLDYRAVAQSADGTTTNNDKTEYRENYLKIGATEVRIGGHAGAGDPPGSNRILLDLGTAVTTVTVVKAAATSQDSGRPAIRLLMNNVSNQVFVRESQGGVGIASEEPAETSTLDSLQISDTTQASRVQTSSGVTIDSWEQTGGVNTINAAATITQVDVSGGQLTSEGDYTITTANVSGGVFAGNHTKSAGDFITTLNLTGGRFNTQGTAKDRTGATLNLEPTGLLISDGSKVTWTTKNLPTDRFSLQMGTQT